jgi:hypothetical protein
MTQLVSLSAAQQGERTQVPSSQFPSQPGSCPTRSMKTAWRRAYVNRIDFYRRKIRESMRQLDFACELEGGICYRIRRTKAPLLRPDVLLHESLLRQIPPDTALLTSFSLLKRAFNLLESIRRGAPGVELCG